MVTRMESSSTYGPRLAGPALKWVARICARYLTSLSGHWPLVMQTHHHLRERGERRGRRGRLRNRKPRAIKIIIIIIVIEKERAAVGGLPSGLWCRARARTHTWSFHSFLPASARARERGIFSRISFFSGVCLTASVSFRSLSFLSLFLPFIRTYAPSFFRKCPLAEFPASQRGVSGLR